MMGTNKWLVGGAVFAVIGAMVVGCTVEDDEDDGPGLGGTSVSGGTAGADAGGTGGASGGTDSGGAPAAGAGGEATGGQAGGPTTTGGQGGGATGGQGGEATGGQPAGGAGGQMGGAGGSAGDGGAPSCLGGETSTDWTFTDCTDWSVDEFVTQQCSGTGDYDGPAADDHCKYYSQLGRVDAFDALIQCMAEYPKGDDDCVEAHDEFMNQCLLSVGAEACDTSEAQALCSTVEAECSLVTENTCKSYVNLVIQSERECIATCWADLTSDQRTGTDCDLSFEDCRINCAP